MEGDVYCKGMMLKISDINIWALSWEYEGGLQRFRLFYSPWHLAWTCCYIPIVGSQTLPFNRGGGAIVRRGTGTPQAHGLTSAGLTGTPRAPGLGHTGTSRVVHGHHTGSRLLNPSLHQNLIPQDYFYYYYPKP